jgi:general secretion pathway protein G
MPETRHHPRAGAFTLVEMVLVAALLAVLVAAAGTQYAKFIEKARVSSAIAEMQAMSRALDATQLDGGELPDSLQGVDAAGTLDPWGRAYEYLKIAGTLPPGQARNEPEALPHVSALEGGGDPKPRKDRFLVPINKDYDLYSRGADGETHLQLDHKDSRDDVVRAANGAYFGLAADF